MAEQTTKKPPSWFKKRVGWAFCTMIILWSLNQALPIWLERGQRTTVINGPLKSDGNVDYIAALNAESSLGVTTENNAAVLLAKALGPNAFRTIDANAYFRELGIAPLPTEGQYLQSFDSLYGKDTETLDRVAKEFDQLNVSHFRLSDHPELARWLELNELPLQRCVEATRRDRFYDPMTRPDGGSLFEVSFPLVQSSREVTRLMSLQIKHHLSEGRIHQALQDSESLHRLSRIIGQHPMLIPQLVAYSQSAVACCSDSLIVNSRKLTAEQARNRRDFFKSLAPFRPTIETVNHAERFQALDAAQTGFLGTPIYLRWIEPNIYLMVINDGYDQVVEAMKNSTVTAQQRSIEAIAEKTHRDSKLDASGLFWCMVSPRREMSVRIARTIFCLTTPAADQAVRAIMRAQIRHEMAIVGYALAEYRAMNENWPVELDDLVPDYLDQVPIDPFNSKPLNYVLNADLNQILLYSVGENGLDDGGIDNQIDLKADDIAFGTRPK